MPQPDADDVSLKEYLDSRLEDLRKYTDTRHNDAWMAHRHEHTLLKEAVDKLASARGLWVSVIIGLLAVMASVWFKK